jgi:hypothetical protein
MFLNASRSRILMVYKLDCRGWSLLQIDYGMSKSSHCSIIGELRERALTPLQILRRGDRPGSRLLSFNAEWGELFSDARLFD